MKFRLKKIRLIFFLPVFIFGGASESIFKLSKFLKKHNENNYKIKEDIKFKIIDNEFIKVKNQTIN